MCIFSASLPKSKFSLYDSSKRMILKRTHTCGELTATDIGDEVILNGWVGPRRDLGGVIFIDLRDRYGVTQVVFTEE
ncbi:MAG TPA: hypothetical protein DD671_11120, partial [Balneolaceae bacterium]|nr:hypothetical protein [Balneolaceae bacterium]